MNTELLSKCLNNNIGPSEIGSVVVFSLLLAACAGSESSSITISGRVSDASGGVASAKISAGVQTATTDSSGSYTLKVSDPGSRLVLTASAAGHGPGRASLAVRSSVYHYSLDIFVPQAQSKLIDPVAGGEITVTSQGRPVTVIVPPGAFSATSQIELRVAGIDAPTGPGLQSTDPAGQNQLQSLGMIHVDAYDRNGNAVKLAAGKSINIAFAPHALASVPGAGQLQPWSLNDDARWQAAGQARGGTSAAGGSALLLGAGPSGADLQAQELGFWNADRAYRTACVRGRIKSTTKSCGGGRVKALGVDGIASEDTTDNNGNFCVEGAQTLTSTVNLGSTTRQVTLPATPGSCQSPSSCMDLGLINVTDQDCPQGCPNGTVDSPDGCRPNSDSPDAGHSGRFTCAGTMQCSGLIAVGRCSWRFCACVDAADSCVRGWYETSDGQYYECSRCVASCQAAAMQLIDHCR